ncbi:hypothetical protein W97_08397 [Coniosporium apollinis CBS 100218]|uniref:FHA domain-containing protein n=1 Tax=Coniosporium apollinis (strain CBS 100218) TaxID=1168221 RepID=R7Z516_CONA1|nr:uncharacterized protein W97_08397 [Coniosporium apollinis CBS 100218]EON69084.1 hypothetical protein W97_08397 [Coniosporium apollinis CBS 100218]
MDFTNLAPDEGSWQRVCNQDQTEHPAEEATPSRDTLKIDPVELERIRRIYRAPSDHICPLDTSRNRVSLPAPSSNADSTALPPEAERARIHAEFETWRVENGWSSCLAPPGPLQSAAFAFLVPISPDALQALKILDNTLLENANACTSLTLGGPSPSCVMKLDFALLSGRDYLSFGSSRSNELTFPEADDIGHQQFLLRFEIEDGVLLLTDTSPHGTLVRNCSTGTSMLLHNDTYQLLSSTHILFGLGQRYHFRIILTENVDFQEEFQELLQTYATSIGRAGPAIQKPPAVTDQDRVRKRRRTTATCGAGCLGGSHEGETRLAKRLRTVADVADMREASFVGDMVGQTPVGYQQSPWLSWIRRAFSTVKRSVL